VNQGSMIERGPFAVNVNAQWCPRNAGWARTVNARQRTLLGNRAPISQNSGKKIPMMNITQ
jgi:hypothetical protein